VVTVRDRPYTQGPLPTFPRLPLQQPKVTCLMCVLGKERQRTRSHQEGTLIFTPDDWSPRKQAPLATGPFRPLVRQGWPAMPKTQAPFASRRRIRRGSPAGSGRKVGSRPLPLLQRRENPHRAQTEAGYLRHSRNPLTKAKISALGSSLPRELIKLQHAGEIAVLNILQHNFHRKVNAVVHVAKPATRT
jgi:hypothetical protein